MVRRLRSGLESRVAVAVAVVAALDGDGVVRGNVVTTPATTTPTQCHCQRRPTTARGASVRDTILKVYRNLFATQRPVVSQVGYGYVNGRRRSMRVTMAFMRLSVVAA